jgi:hypothetical protein
MKRVLTVVLAALLAVSLAGVAGCTKRKSKKPKRSSSDTSRNGTDRTTPTATRTSASPTPVDRAGLACSEIMEQAKTATGVAWRFDEKQTQATADTTRKAGSRKCYYVSSSTTTVPAAFMVVLLYRRLTDSSPEDVRAAAERRAECTEKLPTPPSGATLAVQCLERHSGTLFDVETTVSGQTGYVSVYVSMQPKAASTAVDSKARTISGQAAAVALTSI